MVKASSLDEDLADGKTINAGQFKRILELYGEDAVAEHLQMNQQCFCALDFTL